jgi:AcrR family transcriptional regulator
MRTHGWGGHPPADDKEAIERILEATRLCLDQLGARAGISDVARQMGVTRQTVYRYFPSTEELLRATAEQSAPRFIEGLCRHLRNLGDDPAAVSVEAVAFTLERIPNERYVGLLLDPEEVGTFGPAVTSEPAFLLARSVVSHFPVDWSMRGVDDQDLDELAEHLLRVIQSFVLDSGTPPRRGDELRDYLWRWVAPAVEARCGTRATAQA